MEIEPVIRLRAFAMHAAISAVVVSIVVGSMLYLWYPGIYSETEGVWRVLKVLIVVDIILGPMLTFIVFNPRKASLKFDLACIGLVQIAALAYGAHAIFQQRPEFLVFTIDRFVTVASADVDTDQLRSEALRPSLIQRGPQLVEAVLPQDQETRNELLFSALGSGLDLEHLASTYRSYPQHPQALRERSLQVARYMLVDAHARQAVNEFLARHSASIGDFWYYPLRGKSRDITVALSVKDGLPVGFIDMNPWPETYATTRANPSDSARS